MTAPVRSTHSTATYRPLTSPLADLTPDSYHTLASLCPNLEEITLDLCGRLDTDGIIKWGKTFKHMRRVELEGPFNVRKDGWLKFIETQGKRLEGFLIT